VTWLLAIPPAFVAGFALQRGHICVVLAVREVVQERRWSRFLSFLECAAWALGALLITHAAGWMALSTWPAAASLSLAALGGAIFGAGALVNGACAFGSAGRLAAGETSFLAMLPGFVLGAVIARNVGAVAMTTTASMALGLRGPALAALALTLTAFLVWRLRSAWRAASRPRAIRELFVQQSWPPALAMAVIALANVALMLLVFTWPYTTLLIDVALARGMDVLIRALIVTVFLAGAFWGARTAGAFRLRGAGGVDLAMRFGGGVLMGFGAAMIPGGNDALVLLGLPLLQPAAFAAYAAMVLVIAGGLTVQRVTAVKAA
jgi:toxin CptA